MSSTDKSSLPDLQINGMTLQAACDLVEDMTEMHRNDMGNMVIYSGRSVKFGLVHIILPVAGDPVMLPWLQNVFAIGDQGPLITHSTPA